MKIQDLHPQRLAKNWIKQQAVKFGCLFAIAMVMVAVTWVARLVLSCFDIEAERREQISTKVGESIAMTLLGGIVLFGLYLFLRDEIRKLRHWRKLRKIQMSQSPPPLPGAKLPPLSSTQTEKHPEQYAHGHRPRNGAERW